MKRGAADYVIKTPRHIQRLPHTIHAVLKRQRLQEERAQAEETLQQYAERLKTLREIDQAILAAQSPEEIAQAALRHVRQLVPCPRASVAEFDLEADEATILATHADDESRVRVGTRISLEPFGHTVEELRQGKVQIVEDILSLSLPSSVIQLLQAEGVRSYVNVPLIAQGKLIGTLSLGAETHEVFSQEQLDIVREVADPLAIAIQQARLHEQVQRHAEELGERVRQRTAELRRFVNLMAGREVRMAELKDVIRQLRAQLEAAGLTPVADDPLATGR